jgi:hypothetical protein
VATERNPNTRILDAPTREIRGTEQDPALPRRLGNTGDKDSQPA